MAARRRAARHGRAPADDVSATRSRCAMHAEVFTATGNALPDGALYGNISSSFWFGSQNGAVVSGFFLRQPRVGPWSRYGVCCVWAGTRPQPVPACAMGWSTTAPHGSQQQRTRTPQAACNAVSTFFGIPNSFPGFGNFGPAFWWDPNSDKALGAGRASEAGGRVAARGLPAWYALSDAETPAILTV